MKISSFFNVFKANFFTKKYIFLFFSYFITGICLVLFNFVLANTFSEYEFGLFSTLYAMCMVFSQITHVGTPSLILNKFGIFFGSIVQHYFNPRGTKTSLPYITDATIFYFDLRIKKLEILQPF